MTEGNHDKFLQHLTVSGDPVWLAAKWLHSFGAHVRVNASGRAPSHADWEDYTDCGDIEITQRIEVKALSATFTCKEDWPFGGKAIVCAKHAWDRATPKPFFFINFSADKSHVALIHGDTSSKWFTEKKTDRRYSNVSQEFYICPIDLVRFQRVSNAP